MSLTDRTPDGADPSALVDRLVETAQSLLHDVPVQAVPDQAIQHLLVIAVKLYAAKVEAAEAKVEPFTSGDAVTPTEVGVTVGSMIRMAEIDLFELVAWQSLR